MTDSRSLQALRALAMPVVIVGARDEAGACGATATAMYTSLEPVELVVSLTASSRTAKAVLASRQLSVSLLAGDQDGVAVLVARHSDADDKFADLQIKTTSVDGFDAPALADTTAFWGRLVDTLPSGDHLLMLVRVEDVQLAPAESNAVGALVRLGRSYTSAVPKPPPDNDTYPL